MSKTAIKIRGVSKEFGSRQILKDIKKNKLNVIADKLIGYRIPIFGKSDSVIHHWITQVLSTVLRQNALLVASVFVFTPRYNFLPFNDPVTSAINLNGQTVQLTALGDVTPGNTYTIKLVVADESDTAYDIAVFLEAGSFNIGNVDLGIDLTAANGNARCEGETFTIAPDLSVPPGTTYEWQYESPIGSGVFLPFIPEFEEEREGVRGF